MKTVITEGNLMVHFKIWFEHNIKRIEVTQKKRPL